ncbi:MAG: hypothetical protein LBF62_14790 [Tannerellaceae bacterium]|jgi:hypothetical protein|nr:hypothetical protein [Tannerellaceae bacterium]
MDNLVDKPYKNTQKQALRKYLIDFTVFLTNANPQIRRVFAGNFIFAVKYGRYPAQFVKNSKQENYPARSKAVLLKMFRTNFVSSKKVIILALF